MAKAPQGERLARKISVKTVTGLSPAGIRELVPNKGDSKPIMSVAGVARNFEQGVSDFGDWTALRGEFEAVHMGTGEVHNAGRCFLPRHVVDLVLPAFTGGADNAIEFAVVIGVEWADNNFGYEYTCDTFRDPEKSDRLADMRKLLPAPETASK